MYVSIMCIKYYDNIVNFLAKSSTMARKTKEAAYATKLSLIEAAIDCFAKQGVSATSLASIASHAGITRGAIYWHFKNKIDLLKEVWFKSDQELEELLQELALLYPDNPLEQLKHFLTQLLQSLADNPRRRKIFEILYHKCEFVGEMQGASELQQKLRLEEYPKIEEILQSCITLGQLPKRLDVKRAAIVMRAYISGIIENWLFSPQSFDIKQMAARFVASLLDMLQLSPSLLHSAQD